MRKLSIALIVSGILLLLASTVSNFSSLSEVYDLRRENYNAANDPQSLNELETWQQIANYTRAGMFTSIVVIVAGIVLFRRNENKADKAATKKKIVY